MVLKAARRLKNERGFTLMEGAVSIVLLSITAIGMYNMVVVAHKYIIDAKRLTQATNFARMKLEKIMTTAATLKILPLAKPSPLSKRKPPRYAPPIPPKPPTIESCPMIFFLSSKSVSSEIKADHPTLDILQKISMMPSAKMMT